MPDWLSPLERAYTDGWRDGMNGLPMRVASLSGREQRVYRRGFRDGQHRRANLQRRDGR